MNVEEEIDKSLTEATGFYRAEAVKAAARGIVIDLYIFSEHFVDLASMHYLATLTGGSIHLYPDTRHSSLPQDVHRHIASPQAFLANMRVRTSPDFRVCRCYGKLLEDEQYENLQHIVVCNKLDTFVLDFEHTAGQGFEEDIEWPPMLQLAFQYYTIEQSPVKDRDGNRVVTHSLVRYLRIVTLPWKVSESPKHLQNAVDAEAVICVLMHKVAEALRLDGIAEARLLLQDWLIILVSRYNEAFGLATCGGIDESQSIDVTFQSCYALSTIPRMIYALLRSPLLSTDINNTHPDMRMFQLCLYSVLPPALLRKALYPQLSTYSAEGVVDKMDLPLTRATLTLHPDRIFVLDAFTDIIIYYTPASEGLPFPPPRDSLIRKEAEGLKKHRNISPSLHMIMGGKDVTEIFDRYMIEDEGGGLVKNKDLSNMGYASFMSFIETEVRVYMT